MNAEPRRKTMSPGIEVSPIGGRLGAVLSDVDLARDLDATTVQFIRAALLKYKVIFFRNQELNDQQHETFAEYFGTPEAHPKINAPNGTRYILDLDTAAEVRSDTWHVDVSFTVNPVAISILRPVIIPQAGGETVWANTATAYNDLPPAIRAMADQMWVQHSNIRTHELTYGNPAHITSKMMAGTIHKTRHPLVRVHPETGERTLLLGTFAEYFVDCPRFASSHLFDLFQYYITKPENTLRWHWSMGDVAMWDNRATQHYGVYDYGDVRRVVRRVSIKGVPPVNINGQESTTVVTQSQIC